MEILYQILVKVAEPLYFSLFLIIGKNIKNKRLLLISIMVFEYLLFKAFIHYNVLFQIIYTFMSFVNLKVLYKEKAQITDIFLFAVASIILIITSVLCYGIIYFTIHQYIWVLLINRPLIFAILYFGRNIIPKTYKNFCKVWNRNYEKPNKIRSLTIRNISIIFFNLMFWLLNIGMTLTLFLGERWVLNGN